MKSIKFRPQPLFIGLLVLFTSLYSNPVSAVSFRYGVSNTKININRAYNYATPPGLDNAALLNLKDGIVTSEEFKFSKAYEISGEGTIQIGRSVSDEFGNIYLTGGFTGSIVVNEQLFESTQGYDVFLVKVNTNDEIEWIRTGNGAELDEEFFSIDGGVAMAIDKERNLYIGGGFVQSLTFNNGSGDSLFTLKSSADSTLNIDLFVAKYDKDGTFEWALGGDSNSLGSTSSLEEGRNVVADIELDSQDYPYVIGSFSGTSLFGEVVESKGSSDIFVASLDKDGSEAFWVSTFGTPGLDSGISVSTDTLGYLNILASIGEGVIDFPDSEISWDNDTGTDDTMIMSLDVNGEWYFASFIGAGERITGLDIESTQDGSFYATGSFSGLASFAGSDIELEVSDQVTEGYVVKYNLDGDALWARQFGNTNTEGLKVTSDANENIYVLGSFSGSAVFAKETEQPVVLTTTSTNDLFIAKYDAVGTFQWVKQISGSGSKSEDLIARDEVPFRTNPIDFYYSDTDGDKLFIFGDYSGTLDLAPFELTSTEGQKSGFVAVLDVSETATHNEYTPETPTFFQLHQNYPNPFNPSTTIGFTLDTPNLVSIELFNSMGQKVKTLVNGHFVSGYHEQIVSASNLASGTYYYTIRSGKQEQTKKMLLVK